MSRLAASVVTGVADRVCATMFAAASAMALVTEGVAVDVVAALS